MGAGRAGRWKIFFQRFLMARGISVFGCKRDVPA
jgi:hypothetical protein